MSGEYTYMEKKCLHEHVYITVPQICIMIQNEWRVG